MSYRSMSRRELVRRVSERTGQNSATVLAVLDAVTDTIIASIGAEIDVTILHFGKFEAKHRKARWARNPRTGEKVPVSEGIRIGFKPSRTFKERVASIYAITQEVEAEAKK